MAELSYDRVAAVLKQARQIDQNCELFGASKHQYRLNPPVPEADVRAAEERYGFQLPEDYVYFITKIGNGGAGPDYGIWSFEDSLMTGLTRKFQEAYRSALKKPLRLRPMEPEEIADYAFNKEAYEKNPEKFFVCAYEQDGADDCDPGFLVLGTHGCQWDFGLVVSGKQKGQVFDTDNEGGYMLSAPNFENFYQQWLDWLSEPENIQRELEFWRNLQSKKR